MIILELESENVEGILREMVRFLKKKGKVFKENELYKKLVQREKLGSTAIGEGVAIPHCKIKRVENPVVMLAISKKSVDFCSLDGKPSNIFFLVVSSPDNPSKNLQVLAAIAHLVRKSSSLAKKILKAENIRAVLDVIREEEEKLNG
ncbi:MAG TPA: PTS sugar transporter subunit IIA [Candidatus Aminicenantes bacterium]|nr:PTS sugar transporter subunit IIA [Candidatus Aminicenantes bacterium]